jgi:hypothetical protein
MRQITDQDLQPQNKGEKIDANVGFPTRHGAARTTRDIPRKKRRRVEGLPARSDLPRGLRIANGTTPALV